MNGPVSYIALADLDRRSGTGVSPVSRPTLSAFQPFSPTKWQDLQPPPFDWIVDGCFLRSTVGMVSGDGGLGKSLLMQMLCTATALGRPWLGLETKRSRSLAIFAEDDEDELHRRQHAICRHYGCEPADLDDMMLISRVGHDNLLMNFDRRTDDPKRLPLFDQVRDRVLEFKAQILILDTVADVFGGNEIIRNQVRRFIGELRRLAIEMQGVVIMTAHPSNTGINTGTGISGSTAWNNTVRSRVYLTRSRVQDGEEEDTNERVLKTMKNNQAATGGRIKLQWKDGAFIRMDGSGQPTGTVDRLEIDSLLIEELGNLIRAGQLVAADAAAKTGFANILRKTAKCQHLPFQTIVAAQNRLVDKGRLVLVEMGPPSKRATYIRPADMRYSREKNGETT